MVIIRKEMKPNESYDFITEPQSLPKPSGLSNVVGDSSGSKKKLIFFGGIGLLLIIIAVVLFAVFNNKGPENKDYLLAAALQQSELIRISETGLDKLKNADAQNLAITVKLSLSSDRTTLTAALKAQKVKMPKLGKNQKLENRYLNATQNNRFDQEYMEIMQEQLAIYQKKLNTAFKTSKNSKLKEALKAQYINASTLIGVNPEI